MRKGYDIANINWETLAEIENDLQATMDKYMEKGYQIPHNSLTLIKVMYEKQAEKENRIASDLSPEKYSMLQQRFKGTFFLSGLVEERIRALEGLTKINLLEMCMRSFKRGEPLTFSFNGTMPDDSAKQILNLSILSGQFVNPKRTNELRYIDGFHGYSAKSAEYEIYPEGESIILRGVENPETGKLEDKSICLSHRDHTILFKDTSPVLTDVDLSQG